MTINLATLYAAGSVVRYATNPLMSRLQQTNADHQLRCVHLLYALHPDPSPRLVKAVATHDVGEFLVGDLPSGVARYSATMKDAHAVADARARANILGTDPLVDLNGEEFEWVKFLDRLEPYMLMLMYAPRLKGTDDWPARRSLILQTALILRCRDHVSQTFDAIEVMELKE
jgi:5'-deoxynucleotidase YfbR-like HD superfamily hydrolase